MALCKTVTADGGLEATDAYHRVSEVQLIGKTQMTFVLCSFRGPPVMTDQDPMFDMVEDPDNEGEFKEVDITPPPQPVDQPIVAQRRVFAPYDLEGPNPIEQAYAFLKQGDFEGATDC